MVISTSSLGRNGSSPGSRNCMCHTSYSFLWHCPLWLYLLPEVSRLNKLRYIYLICREFWGGVNGLNHLWFMTAIGLCYLITPVLQRMRDKHCRLLWLILITAAIVEYAFARVHLYYFSWCFLYAFGYGYAVISEKFRRIIDVTLLLLVAGFILLELRWEVILEYGSWQNRFFHDMSGLVLLFGGIRVLQGLKLNRVPSVVLRLDKLSYPVYIVHHIFILGPFSLAFLTSHKSLNVIIMLTLSMAVAILLGKTSQIVTKRFPNLP